MIVISRTSVVEGCGVSRDVTYSDTRKGGPGYPLKETTDPRFDDPMSHICVNYTNLGTCSRNSLRLGQV